MYKNTCCTSGFEVTYEPYPSSEFSDWPTETHLFGTDYLGGDQEEISLSHDLQYIEFCLDATSGRHHNIEGLTFLEYNNNYQYLGPECKG